MLVCSLRFSSSASIASVHKQSSHLSCGLPSFLQPLSLSRPYRYLVFFDNPSSFILIFRLLPTMQTSVPISSLRSFIMLLAILFMPATILLINVLVCSWSLSTGDYAIFASCLQHFFAQEIRRRRHSLPAVPSGHRYPSRSTGRGSTGTATANGCATSAYSA